MQTKQKEEEKKSSDLDGMREKLAQSKVNTSLTRKVKLIYKSCCGCGCDTIDLIREVDTDSELKDGDRIYDILENDEVL